MRMNSIAASSLTLVAGMLGGTGIIGKVVWDGERKSRELESPPAQERVLDELPVSYLPTVEENTVAVTQGNLVTSSKEQSVRDILRGLSTPGYVLFEESVVNGIEPLPDLFKPYDYNDNRRIDMEEAIDFFRDKAGAYSKQGGWYEHPKQLTKELIENVISWYIKVAYLNSTKPDEKELCLDIAAGLSRFMQGKDSIPTPISRALVKYDKDSNRILDVNEGIKFYEAENNVELERNENGEISSLGLRKVIDFVSKRWSANILKAQSDNLYETMTLLEAEYEKRFGIKYSIPAKEDPEKIINR